MNPNYIEQIIDGRTIRTHETDGEIRVFFWLKDPKDIVCEVLQTGDWYYILGDGYPENVSQGDIFTIPKNTPFKFIKNSGILVVEIKKVD
jgi:hypothetical protein